MKERLAQYALMLGVCHMAVILALYLSTGGFTTELFGLRISLYRLKNSTVITITFVLIWLLLSKDGMPILSKLIHYIDQISLESHKKIAYFLGLVAAIYISLLKVKTAFCFSNNRL